MYPLCRTVNFLRYGVQQFRCRAPQITAGNPGWRSFYRQCPPPNKKMELQADIFGAVMWFWILWHFWHNPDAVFGHFPWPEASEWTDEELGIPPDEE